MPFKMRHSVTNCILDQYDFSVVCTARSQTVNLAADWWTFPDCSFIGTPLAKFKKVQAV